MPRLSVNRKHLEQSGEQLQEKAEEIYDKNRQN